MLENNPVIPWEELFIPKWEIKPIPEVDVKPIIGFDTETLDGYARIITDSNGTIKKISDINDVLKFFSSKKYRHTTNFFYNSRFDIAAMLKYLPEDNIRELVETNKTEYGKYKLFNISKKVFSISSSKHTCKYYDVAQYFNTSLDLAAKKYLTSRKEPDGLDRSLIGTSRQYWDDNYDRIVKYCVQDSVVCQELAQLLSNTLVEYLDIKPKNYISTAALGKQYFRKNCDFWSIHQIPQSVIALAYKAYGGGWFEMFKKGTFEGGIYDSDINSAYPDAIRNFPDINKGVWERVDKVNSKALLGFYKVTVYVPKSMPISPIPLRIGKNIIQHPTGTFVTYLTKLEIDSYQKDIDINIDWGWEYYDENPIYPFKEEIEKLYSLKEKLASSFQKDRFEYTLYKKIMTSFYGTTLQKNPINPEDRDKYEGKSHKTGILFNPVMGAFITAWCRVMIWEVIRDHINQIIAIATDGILSIGSLGLKNSLALGEWEVNKADKLTMFQPGIYCLDQTIKTRGMERAKKIKATNCEYDHIFEYLSKEPYRVSYPITSERPVSVSEALIKKKYTIEDINKFEDITYNKDINTDHKRVWNKKFMSGGHVLKSKSGSTPYHIQ